MLPLLAHVPLKAHCAGVWAFLERGAAEVAAAAAAAAAAEPGALKDANPSLLAAAVSGNAPEHCVAEWDKSKVCEIEREVVPLLLSEPRLAMYGCMDCT